MTCVCRWPLRVDRDTRMYICWKDLFDTPAAAPGSWRHPVRFWKPGANSPVAVLATRSDVQVRLAREEGDYSNANLLPDILGSLTMDVARSTVPAPGGRSTSH